MMTVFFRFFLLFVVTGYSAINSSQSSQYPINKNDAASTHPPLTKSMPGFLTKNDLLTVGVLDSSQFGLIAEANYLQLINDWNMFGLELELGPNENRQNMTWGLWFTPNQKIKFTAERLAQNISFDFVDKQARYFVPQYAGGVTYKYLINDNHKKILNSIDLGGYYSSATSRIIGSDGFFYQNSPLPDHDSDDLFVSTKYISGATAYGLNLGADLRLWKGFLLTTALNYDSVYYPSYLAINNPANQNLLGVTAEAKQRFNDDKFELEALGSHRAIYDEYRFGGRWYICNRNMPESALSLTDTYVMNNNSLPNDNRIELKMDIRFDAKNHCSSSYSPLSESPNTMWQWTSKPAVHMDAVLATSENLISGPTDVNPGPGPGPFPFAPAIQVAWAGNPFSTSTTFPVDTAYTYSYQTIIQNAALIGSPPINGLPNWVLATPINTTVTLTGVAPAVQMGTVYHFLVTATDVNDSDNVLTADAVLQVVPKQLRLQYILSNQGPQPNVSLDADQTSGQYLNHSPPAILKMGEEEFTVTANGTLSISGSFTYIVKETNAWAGMGCRVSYNLTPTTFTQTATAISATASSGLVPRCQLSHVLSGMTTVASLFILPP